MTFCFRLCPLLGVSMYPYKSQHFDHKNREQELFLEEVSDDGNNAYCYNLLAVHV